jgi:hypothetical protein
MKKHNAINYHAVREAVAAGIFKSWKGRWQNKLGGSIDEGVMGQKRWDFCYCLFC